MPYQNMETDTTEDYTTNDFHWFAKFFAEQITQLYANDRQDSRNQTDDHTGIPDIDVNHR